MPGLITDSDGTIKEVDDLSAEFQAFKERSDLKYRRRRGDVGPFANASWLYDYLSAYTNKLDKVPKRGTREYDIFIDRQWKDEPILAGVVYGMVAKAQAKPWRIEGGRNNATQAAKMLANARYGFYQSGWDGFMGSSALDFYTTRMGFVWGVKRQGSKFGRLTQMEHIDALSCDLTGSFTHPVRYTSPETGQVIRFRDTDVIQHNSMTLSRETELSYGFCAVERCLLAIRMLIGLHNYDIEKLSNLPPEGIAVIRGLTQEEFLDSLELWKSKRQKDNNLTYPQVLWLLNQDTPSEKLAVEVTPFSTLPENFTRDTVILQYINMIANAFGISASDVWFMGGGPFGTGKEVELQHSYAKGKGEGEWFSLTQRKINRELPNDTHFAYDTRDIEEDRIAAETVKVWVDAYMPMVAQSQVLDIDVEDWKRLFVSKGVLPAWFMDDADFPPPQTEITSDRSLRLKDAQDIIAFVWEMGKLKERPVITTYRHKEGKIGKGWWGPPKGDHVGKAYAGLSVAVAQNVQEGEDRHRDRYAVYNKEVGRVVGADGAVLWESSGSADTLTIPAGDYTDAVFTHNHPPAEAFQDRFGTNSRFAMDGVSQPFSISDLAAAQTKNFAEMRVVGLRNGTPVTFRAIRSGSSWPDMARYISNNYQGFIERARAAWDGKQDAVEFSYTTLDGFWGQASQDLGFGYEVSHG